MLQWDLQLFEPNLYKIQIIRNHLYLLGTCVRVWGGGDREPACQFGSVVVSFVLDCLIQKLPTESRFDSYRPSIPGTQDIKLHLNNGLTKCKAVWLGAEVPAFTRKIPPRGE